MTNMVVIGNEMSKSQTRLTRTAKAHLDSFMAFILYQPGSF